jgi:hypothetical protein
MYFINKRSYSTLSKKKFFATILPQSELKKAEREDAIVHGMRVLTKTQWRRLRNRYLNEQRKNMSAAKAFLRKRKPPTNDLTAGGVRAHRKPCDLGEETNSNSLAPPTTMESGGSAVDNSCATASPAAESGTSQPFTPGVIVKVSIESGRIFCFLN